MYAYRQALWSADFRQTTGEPPGPKTDKTQTRPRTEKDEKDKEKGKKTKTQNKMSRVDTSVPLIPLDSKGSFVYYMYE